MRKKSLTAVALAVMMSVPVSVAGMAAEEITVYGEADFDENAHGAVVENGNCGANGSNVKYTLYADGTVYFSGKGKMKLYENSSTTPSPLENRYEITRAVFAEGITSISQDLLYGCTSLREVRIPSTITSMGGGAFEGTAWLNEEIAKNPLVIVNNIVIDGRKCNGTVAVPEGVTLIADGAFEDNKDMQYMYLPSSLQTIGKEAFYNCSGLIAASMAEGVMKIEEYAFSECPKLEKAVLPSKMSVIEKGAFSECPRLEKVVLPSELSAIGESIFWNCKSLHRITLPSGITAISDGMFFGCESLKYIEIPAGVKTIGENAFNGCQALESVRMESGVNTIKAGAFGYCDKLRQISVPASVINISDKYEARAFDYDEEEKKSYYPEDFTVYGAANSQMEAYARKYGFKFSTAAMPQYVDDGDDDIVMPEPPYTGDADQKLFPKDEAFDEGSLVAGDADKDQAVTLRDAYLTLKASLGVITFNDRAKKATDMNHDSQVDLEDVQLILRKVLRISDN